MKTTMKKASILCVVMICIVGAAAAQSPLELNLATTSTELFPINGTLVLKDAWLTAVSVNWAPPILGGSTGPVTFTMPRFATGSIAAGGVRRQRQLLHRFALGRESLRQLCAWHVDGAGLPRRMRQLRPTRRNLRNPGL